MLITMPDTGLICIESKTRMGSNRAKRSNDKEEEKEKISHAGRMRERMSVKEANSSKYASNSVCPPNDLGCIQTRSHVQISRSFLVVYLSFYCHFN
jgi:hypothetical protein